MAKAPMTPFAQVLKLLEKLTDSDKATLRDVLRPAPTPRKTKLASRKPKPANATLPLVPAASPANEGADTETETGAPMCAACGHEEGYQDHYPPSPHYHPFASSASAAKKRSKPKEAHTLSVPSSEMQPGFVGNAVLAANASD